MENAPLYFAIALLAALVSLVGTRAVRRIALSLNIADAPNERRINTTLMPRAGGFAVALSFFLVGAAITILAAPLGLTSDAPLSTSGIAALLLGVLLAGVIGLADDRFDLRARWQLAGQLVISAVPIAFGVRIAILSNPFGAGDLLIPDAIGLALTLFWALGMQNAMNFIDGLDGLSGGIALIAAVTLGVIALPATPLLAALCFALAGALAGFLRHNFYPASIYMGTSGILAVAYALAVLSLLGTAKVVAALLILGVPIIDAFFVIMGRLLAGRSPYSADKTHIHQRLIDAGLSHRAAVLVLYGVTLLLSIGAVVLTESAALSAFVGLLVVLGGAIVWLSRRAERRA
jgi:UDP-GlcNAc:undecaprenyl-phosphate GlcNAc-1-phosphate transferase